MIFLYGGSFNPPTIAHFKIAQSLIELYQPKQFIFIPVGKSYNKQNLVPFEFRYDMLNILCRKLSNATVSDYENRGEKFKGTIDTLNYFKSLYNEEIYYIIGADNLLSFDSWIHYEDILNHYKILVLNRDDFNATQFIREHKVLSKFKNSFLIVDEVSKIHVSSTDYREGHDEVVLKEVNEFIYKHGLYHRGGRND